MSDVVLRCPHCGTTQARTGECEACHESDVRYFCGNHAPGRWLDGPTCDACGARFGVERPAARPVPPVPPMPVPPREERRTTPRGPAPRPTPPRTPGLPWPGFPRMPRAPRTPPAPADDPWIEPRVPTDAGYGSGSPRGWEPPPIRISPMPVFGCVGRLVKLVIAMIILLFSLGMCFFYGAGGNFVTF